MSIDDKVNPKNTKDDIMEEDFEVVDDTSKIPTEKNFEIILTEQQKKELEHIHGLLEGSSRDMLGAALLDIANGNIKSSIPDLLEYIIDKYNIDTSSKDFSKYIVDLGSLEALEFLISKGKNIDLNFQQKNTNMTSLMSAVTYGRKDVVEFLITKNVDLNIKNTDGNNVLHEAIINHHPDRNRDLTDITKELLKTNININSKNKKGETPLDVALRDNSNLVEMLKEHGAKTNDELLVNKPLIKIFNTIKNFFTSLISRKETIKSSEADLPEHNSSIGNEKTTHSQEVQIAQKNDLDLSEIDLSKLEHETHTLKDKSPPATPHISSTNYISRS